MAEIRVLGPLEIVDEAGAVLLPPPKQRRLLASLVIPAGETVSADLLIDALWGASPPPSAAKLLHVYVSKLRRALPAPTRIRTRGSGYALELEESSLDAARFERLFGEGRAASREGNAVLATSLLRRALSLWRGQAYGELAYEEFVRPESERLEELRLVALEERLEAELALGRPAEVLSELRSLATAHPLRERLQAQSMLALYRCGRQAEALDVYAQARARLDEELGLEPAAELRELQRRILQHDPKLALSTAAATPASALPEPPNRLLGRGRELEELRTLILRDDVRLLVLAGAGGSGKTRLALEAARASAASFANGAVFVELAPLRDRDLLVAAIAQALGVEELPGEPVEALASALRARELLLLLDNAEHLRPATAVFVELLARAPRLTLLVTSRVVLHLSGEHVYPVEPLRAEAARALFHERAREADAHFNLDATGEHTIDRICERLDGLPLAIELAASRVRTLHPGELLARLDPRLPLLTGGPHDLPARQQSLRATLEWSFELLDEGERRDLCRLTVFAGGCTLETAEAVCGTTLERLSSFVDHNLLRRTAGPNGSRYTMLETIRDFALDQLDDGTTAEIGRLHLEFFLAFLESANLFAEAEGPQRHDIVISEQGNLRAALEFALTAGQVELGLQLAVIVENFWVTHNPFEGMHVFRRLLDADPGLPTVLRARALRAFGSSAYVAGDHAQAERLYEESLGAFRAIGDERGTAILLHRLGMNAVDLGELGRARPLLEESLELFSKIGSRRGETQTIGSLGSLARAEGNAGPAVDLFERSAAMAAEIGRTWWEARMLTNIAELALDAGRTDETVVRARDALRLGRQVGDRQTILNALGCLASAAAVNGDVRIAGHLWGALEAEEARGAVGEWKRDRDQHAARILACKGPEFESGLREGRQLSLETAVEEALAD